MGKLKNERAAIKETDLAKLSEEALERFADILCHIKTGEEINAFTRYDKPEVLRSVYNRIDNLYSSGLFKTSPPLLSRSKAIWRYDIRSLSDEEQCYLSELYLIKIFLKARERGIIGNTGGISQYVLLDEAQKVIRPEPDHIINVIVRESRKFGMGMCFSSQSHRHFTTDVITNCGTKVLLGSDSLDYSDLCKKFGIPEQQISSIRPRCTGLIQIKKHGDLNNDYIPLDLTEKLSTRKP
jgi:DNA helicase HerA-like ATPase